MLSSLHLPTASWQIPNTIGPKMWYMVQWGGAASQKGKSLQEDRYILRISTGTQPYNISNNNKKKWA